MQITVIASGSNGNACLVEENGTSVLFDAGLSGRQLETRLGTLGKTLADADALIISHAHGDHFRGAGVVCRRYDLPLYMTRSVHRRVAGRISLKNVRVHEYRLNGAFRIDSLEIRTIETSHDEPSTGFVVGEFGIFTDTGKVTRAMKDVMPELGAVLLESNYDPDMLMNGPYPEDLIARIESETGHLANDAASEFVEECGERLKLVMLGHLSGENNTPGKASGTFESTVTRRIEYHVCPRDRAAGTWKI